VLLSWSSGKDSAWTLHVLRSRGVDVVGLFTTVGEQGARVAIHDVRPELLAAQAEVAGLPLFTAAIPDPCPNVVYERVMAEAMSAARTRGVTHVAFGDLFLEDIRAYREAKLRGSGIEPLFPLFGVDTRRLAREMIDAGLRALLVTTDTRKLPFETCGKELRDVILPADVDPCGENGEFHTFVFGGPMFSRTLAIDVGVVEQRGDYAHADVTLSKGHVHVAPTGAMPERR
jgi:uncharacterized protein (TIGR00290 family)